MRVLRHAWPLLVALLAGCNAVALGAGDRGSVHARTLVEACPLGVPWAQIRTADTADGEALFFSAPASSLEDLRRRVHDQARANGPDRHRGSGHEGEHHGPRDHGLRLWSLGEVKATAENTADGAKLVVVAVDPARRDEVRKSLLKRVDELNAADCPK